MTKQDLLNYLIDCLGYSEDQDLKGLSKADLLDLVQDLDEFYMYID